MSDKVSTPPINNFERFLLVEMLKHPAGYHLGLFATLELRSCTSDGLCQGHLVYAVDYNEPGQKVEEWLFSTPEEAADFFLQKRQELELGLDYEMLARPTSEAAVS